MTRVAMSALIAACAGLLAASPAASMDRKTGEEKLAEMLEGRVAGEPESCIRTFGNGNLTVIDKTALVYKRGDTIWVNRTRFPETLDDNDYLVIKKYGTTGQLCRLDNVTTRDRGGNFFSGVIFLEDFVPDRKPAGAEG